MPLVEISLRSGKPASYRRAIGDSVHSALVEVLSVPADDHFQIITEHSAENVVHDPQYLGIERDVFVALVEIQLENWSFGNGVAQYADNPPTWINQGILSTSAIT